MKPRTLLCALALLLLAGCGAAPQGIPEGLTWTAQTLQSQENGDILAAAEGTSFPDAAPLDVTAQVEGDMVTLTDHTSGETYTGALFPAWWTDPEDQIYELIFHGDPQGKGVTVSYGITEYSNGSRDATLLLTLAEEKQVLRLTAPLSET